MSDRWPEFEMVAIDSATDVPPSIAEYLASSGVPRMLIGREYRALHEATVLSVSETGSQRVSFGTCGRRGRICIDTESLAIIHVPVAESAASNPVNASMSLFSTCVRAIIDRFPFYGEDSELEEREAVAAELRQTLSAIDSAALSHNGFWETFLDDLTIGDYATEEIVGADD